jgi:hypothetical protein
MPVQGRLSCNFFYPDDCFEYKIYAGSFRERRTDAVPGGIVKEGKKLG